MIPISGLPKPLRSIARRVRDFRLSTAGGVAALAAILSPVLIGGMGLGGEAGYWYLTQRKVQNAADVAAHAAALRSNEGDSDAALQSIAEYLVGEAEVSLAATNVTLNQPPLTGGFIEDGAAIEVVVTQTVPRMFSAIYDPTDITIAARAVATAEAGGQGCVIALSETQQGALTISGSGFLSLTGCDFVSNAATADSFLMSGLGSVAVSNCVQASGTVTATANLTTTCTSYRENASPVSDPFASVVEPPATGACQDGDVGQNNQTTTVTPNEVHASGMSAMRFCNGLNLSGTVTLNPGLYIIEGGDFRINSNANIFGNGVTFYLRDGVEMRFNGTANTNLTAPTSGVFNGILFFGARDATTMSHQINGNFGSSLNGAIYTSASHIDFQGNMQTSFTSCTQVIGNTLNFSGNGFLSMHCLFPPGPVATIAGTVRVVE